jgi:hypothetical protein
MGAVILLNAVDTIILFSFMPLYLALSLSPITILLMYGQANHAIDGLLCMICVVKTLIPEGCFFACYISLVLPYSLAYAKY